MLAFHGLQTDAYSEVQKILSRLTAGLYHRAADVGEDRTERGLNERTFTTAWSPVA